MASILVIHGIGQQVEGELTLRDRLFPALRQGLARANRSLSPGDVEFVSYGELFRAPAELLSATQFYDAADVEEGYEQDLLATLWERAASVDASVVPPSKEVLSRTPIWARRALAALSGSRFLAGIADRILIGDLKQVRIYFTNSDRRSEVQQRVAMRVGTDTRLLVGHSLGSVVAYEALCANPGWDIPTLVTLGSPLGIPNLVFDRLRPAPVARRSHDSPRGRWPESVRSWTNIADAGDVVAAVEDLRPLFGNRVKQIRVHNSSHAHDLRPYLTERLTGIAIAEGMDA